MWSCRSPMFINFDKRAHRTGALSVNVNYYTRQQINAVILLHFFGDFFCRDTETPEITFEVHETRQAMKYDILFLTSYCVMQ